MPVLTRPFPLFFSILFCVVEHCSWSLSSTFLWSATRPSRLDVIGIEFWGFVASESDGVRRIFIAVLATLGAFRLMYVTPSGGDRVPHFLLD